jgi:CheY-like chemotaxis protein
MLLAAKPTVLVVEDEADLRTAYCEALQAAGYEVAMAANGYEALRVLSALEHPPCIILLDLTMPVLEGQGFIARLRANATLPPIPVLVVTGSVAQLPPGAQGLVRKPVKLDSLLAEVARHCKGEHGDPRTGSEWPSSQ